MKGNIGKICEFIGYTVLIYLCYISSGVYHEKILKHKYISQSTPQGEYFNAPISFTFFPQIACTILGFIIIKIMHWRQDNYQITIPARKSILCSTVINLNMWTYNKAVIEASFPAVVMVKSCSLLSVILVGIFCSRVRDKDLKLGKSKIWIGATVTIGIILFNFFKVQQGTSDKPITIFSCFLLLVSLMGDGFLPDLQAQIKSQHKPSVMQMYFTINKYTATIAFLYATVTFQLSYITTFIQEHKQLQTDLLFFSILNALGQLVVYRMIKMFKQHIPAFVIATRKCFTVIVNIIYFNHSINLLQILGMSLVFLAVMMQVYESYKQKQQKQRQQQADRIKQIQSQRQQLGSQMIRQTQDQQQNPSSN